MKILIVEDDLEISKLLADFLQGNGYEVLCQYDGLDVLDCIQGFRFRRQQSYATRGGVTFNCERICYTGIAYEIPGQDLLKGEFVSKCLEYRVYQRGQHLECPY